jgi:D-alanyl-D-alanine carboxypeptidase/D-alanyl-D-alanine-endopeptidase (penicillin-binding protein 4)
MILRKFLWPALILVPLSSAVADTRDTFPDSVARMLSAYKMPATSLSVFAQEVGEDTPLIAVNSDVPRNPASTIKLLTTFLALEDLGPTYRWKTDAYLGGPLVEGRLEGDLIIKGYGDPYMLLERYWLFLRELRQHGLQRIEGDLVIDNSYFEIDATDNGTFDGQPERIYNVVPDAFLVNFQAVDFVFRPDADSGGVSIVADPHPANLDIANKLGLRSGLCGGYQNGIKMEVGNSGADDSRDRVTFSGRFRGQCREYLLSRAVLRAPTYAWGVFDRLWTQMGGELQGGLRLAAAPEDAEPFVEVESPPLLEIIHGVNKWSNNIMARHILLTMGAERSGAPATVEKGREAAAAVLASEGLDFPELRIDNGAGLSRDTRITARNLGRVLLAAQDSLYAAEYVSSMPLSGLDGTMRKRFKDEELTGRMHLKTGRLTGVFAMAGYLRSRSGRDFVVVAIQSHANAHRGPGEEIESEFMRWVYSQ